jgi:aspartyl-tRNA(Asn)/glutamyl-tRNA(Gln) amidotransferase subunit B
MPDPDVPPVVLTDAQIEKAKAETPILPHEWRKKFTELGFDKSLAEALLDAEVEFEDSKYLDLIVEFSNDKVLTKRYANWVVNLLAPLKREKNIGLKMPDLKTLIVVVDDLLKTNKLSSTAAKQLIESVLQSKKLPKDIAGFAEAEGLIQLSDTSELDKIVSEVLTGNQKAADDVRNGETKAIGFLIGQCMKLSKGQGNPQLFQELIKKQLGV